MSDISLLMNGVLTGNPASLPDQFPVKSPIQSDNIGQSSTQDSSQTFPHADMTPPEFLQVDSNIAFASPFMHEKYQNNLSKEGNREQGNQELGGSFSDMKVTTKDESSPSSTHASLLKSGDPPMQLAPLHPYTFFHSDPEEESEMRAEFSPYSSLAPPVDEPGKTYGDNCAITCYEFAAGLETCLQQIEELLTSNKYHTIDPEDLILLQRLQNEVKEELAELQQHVTLSDRNTNKIATHQFSTTTNLFGQAIFNLQGTNILKPLLTNSRTCPKSNIPDIVFL